jgi:hypothetical protein
VLAVVVYRGDDDCEHSVSFDASTVWFVEADIREGRRGGATPGCPSRTR